MTRPIRFLLSREENVDPHVDWIVAQSLRDAGFEVILGGILSPEQTAETARDEGVDLVGYGARDHRTAATRLIAHMHECGIGGLPVAIGASLGESEEAALREIGVQEVFNPRNVTKDTLERFRAVGRLQPAEPERS